MGSKLEFDPVSLKEDLFGISIKAKKELLHVATFWDEQENPYLPDPKISPDLQIINLYLRRIRFINTLMLQPPSLIEFMERADIPYLDFFKIRKLGSLDYYDFTFKLGHHKCLVAWTNSECTPLVIDPIKLQGLVERNLFAEETMFAQKPESYYFRMVWKMLDQK